MIPPLDVMKIIEFL